MAAFGVSGCAHPVTPVAPLAVTAVPSSAAAGPANGPLPAPQALTAVLDRLADPAVPGGDKLTLIEDGTVPDAATLDRFASALRDGGYAPAVFTAGDLAWSPGRAGEVLATVRVTPPTLPSGTAPEDRSAFAFPLAFRHGPAGWQLTRQTAEMLLAFPPEQ